MKPKKSILILSPFFHPNVGGVETHLDDLGEYLRKGNYRVTVLTYQPLAGGKKGLPVERKENLEVRRFGWLPNLYYRVEPYPILNFLFLTPWLLIRTFFFLLKNSRRIDVIHAHGFNAALIARVLKPVFKKRTIVSTHATYELEKKPNLARLVKWSLETADKILTLSQMSKRELLGVGLTGEKIEVYTYWINQRVFRPLDKKKAKKEIGWPGKFVVFFVGRMVAVKGIRELLAAAETTKQGVVYALAGSGDLDEEVRAFVQDHQNVVFLGRVDNQNLPWYYSAADLVIVPSTHDEGFGRVILEALSCGTPVIGANRGAIPEALDESVGRLIEVSPKNIKTAVEFFYDHPEKLGKMVGKARQYAEQKFSEKNAELIVRAYEEDR